MNEPENSKDSPKVTAEDLVAFLDGELAGSTRASIEAKVSLDPEVRTEAQELKGVWDLLDFLPKTEASEAFTARTMEQLIPQTGSAPHRASDTAPMRQTSRWSGVAKLLFVGLILIAIGLSAGVLGETMLWNAPPPQRDAQLRQQIDTLPVADLRVIERLPFYRHIPDLAFLQRLHRDGWFVEIEPDAIPGTRSRDDLEYLAAQLDTFRSLPTERQDQLRQLDRELFDLPTPVRDRLTLTMAAYVKWLGDQDEARREELQALPVAERLSAIAKWREVEWSRRWPGVRVRTLAEAPASDHQKLIREWRDKDLQWHAEWRWARERGDAELSARGHRWPLPLYSQEFRRQVTEYVENRLKPRLTDSEADRMKRAEREFREGDVFAYAAVVAELAEAHPELPGPVEGPRNFDELPSPVRQALRDAMIEPDAPELIGKTGKWPEFARALTLLVRKRGVELPQQLGPATLNEFDAPTQMFIKQVRTATRNRVEMKQLRDAEGRWPEFPETVRDLAQKHGIPSPVEGLPGTVDGWNQLRREAKKAPSR